MPPTLSTPIAYGRTAEVYPWEPGTILKLYHDWCPPHWVEHEARVARAITAAGIPTPSAGEIVEVNGRRGLVYERVDGCSMLAELNARPWKLFEFASALAEIQVQIHGLSIPGLQSYRENMRNAIAHAHLPASLKAKAAAALDQLPDGATVCHGDFHPGNILMTARGPLVIDWMTACSGDPWADVARSALLLTVGVKAAGKQVSRLSRLGIRLFYNLYLDRYRKLSPHPEARLERWLPVAAAARLNENIQPERDDLLRLVEKLGL